jgi:hypothetical protein
MYKLLVIFLISIATGLTGCKGGDAPAIPAQSWNGDVVRIETHPSPPLAGMSEVVVIVTGPHGKPVGDLMVSLRGNDAMPWVQAIQDGFIGVYRRAVDIGDGETAVVQVKLQRGQDQKTLLFPLKLAAG